MDAPYAHDRPGHCREPGGAFLPNRWREECGVFGIWAPGEAVGDLCYLGLFALQHRGQESAGIAVTNGLHIDEAKGMGLMTVAFRERRPALAGHAAIGHVRYSTYGSSNFTNIQPIFAYSEGGFIGLAHNGNLTNAGPLRDRMAAAGSVFQTTTDSEVMLNLIALSREGDILKRIEKSLAQVTGAYSLVMLTPDRMIGLRDPMGYRPLCLGRLASGGWVVASESCALDAVKAEMVREIEPGELVAVGAGGMESRIFGKSDLLQGCIFEHIYFARPDSVLDGKSVWRTRFEMGRQLAREFSGDADLVMPVPDTGITAALGFSAESGLPYVEGLIKNRYVGRSFIMPEQLSRETAVEMKLNPIRANLEGKRVVLIDDSIVRGTTSARIISLIRRAGTAAVHLCVSSPPITHPCYYGIDTSVRRELIASRKTVPEIRDFLRLDSLHYLSKKGLLEAVGDPDNGKSCMECFK
ncbi:MAG: amidophosphoribosyltransferase [Deltaproteobacteria bacterium]|jgi:amidophosphoribosyltransferase|nr:amidophosphoribosyltransferase [Deltaproteobacteria bacterium]